MTGENVCRALAAGWVLSAGGDRAKLKIPLGFGRGLRETLSSGLLPGLLADIHFEKRNGLIICRETDGKLALLTRMRHKDAVALLQELGLDANEISAAMSKVREICSARPVSVVAALENRDKSRRRRVTIQQALLIAGMILLAVGIPGAVALLMWGKP